MNCFHSMTGGDIRDDILQLQIDNLTYSLSIDNNKLTLRSKDDHIVSSVDLPIPEQIKVISMELKDESIILTLSDDSKITCSLSDIYSKIETKQDKIDDIEAIRSGSVKGTTAVQPETLEETLSNYVTYDEWDTNANTIEDNVYSINPKRSSQIISCRDNLDSNIDTNYFNMWMLVDNETPNIDLKPYLSGYWSFSDAQSTKLTDAYLTRSKLKLNASKSGLIGAWIKIKKSTTSSTNNPNYQFQFKNSTTSNSCQFYINKNNAIIDAWHFYRFDLNTSLSQQKDDTVGYTNKSNNFDITNISEFSIYASSGNNCVICVGPIAIIDTPLNNEFIYKETVDVSGITEQIDGLSNKLDETSKAFDGKLNSYPINNCFMITGIQSYDPYIELGKYVEFIDESPTISKKLASISSYYTNVSNLINDIDVSIIKSTLQGTGLDCSDTNLFGIWLYCTSTSNMTVSVQLSSYAVEESDIWTVGWDFVETPDSEQKQHQLFTGWHFYKLNVELYDEKTNDGLDYTSFVKEGLSTVAFDKTKINKLDIIMNKQNTASGLFRVSQAGKITSIVNDEFFDQAVTDRHINDLIDAKLGAIKNGS